MKKLVFLILPALLFAGCKSQEDVDFAYEDGFDEGVASVTEDQCISRYESYLEDWLCEDYCNERTDLFCDY